MELKLGEGADTSYTRVCDASRTDCKQFKGCNDEEGGIHASKVFSFLTSQEHYTESFAILAGIFPCFDRASNLRKCVA